MAEPARLTLFYDGACPLCRREVAFYRRLDRDGRIDWADISEDARPLLGSGIGRRQALRRIYARTADGRLLSGARAFVALWRELPGFRLAAPLLALPPLIWGLEGLYRLFLLVRPRLTGRPRDCCGPEE